jgi:hypothetical protein
MRTALVLFAILLCTAACSTKPVVRPPVPSVCFALCEVNQCKLTEAYDTLAPEDQVDTELRCIKENADSARYCAELKRKCAEGLTTRSLVHFRRIWRV